MVLLVSSVPCNNIMATIAQTFLLSGKIEKIVARCDDFWEFFGTILAGCDDFGVFQHLFTQVIHHCLIMENKHSQRENCQCVS